jgi:hypothetical protein
VDNEHPWLGLDSFSEETRQFFHGREDEIGELARRVQRKTLAILFGQSGLGKTSILRAGIVPRLRREGFCPVYVRIDYSRDSPRLRSRSSRRSSARRKYWGSGRSRAPPYRASRCGSSSITVTTCCAMVAAIRSSRS